MLQLVNGWIYCDTSSKMEWYSTKNKWAASHRKTAGILTGKSYGCLWPWQELLCPQWQSCWDPPTFFLSHEGEYSGPTGILRGMVDADKLLPYSFLCNVSVIVLHWVVLNHSSGLSRAVFRAPLRAVVSKMLFLWGDERLGPPQTSPSRETTHFFRSYQAAVEKI